MRDLPDAFPCVASQLDQLNLAEAPGGVLDQSVQAVERGVPCRLGVVPLGHRGCDGGSCFVWGHVASVASALCQVHLNAKRVCHRVISMRPTLDGAAVCVYCGAEAAHIDHVRAVSRGGTNDPTNLVSACLRCNLSKSDKLLGEWDPQRVAHGLIHSTAVAVEYARLLTGEPWEYPEFAPKPTLRYPSGTRSIIYRVPTSLVYAARAAQKETGDTVETWFLDAFDAVFDQLDEAYRRVRADRQSGVPVRQRRQRQSKWDPLMPYALRLTPEELAVLEERVTEVGAPSKADCVTTIVRLRLQQLGKTF